MKAKNESEVVQSCPTVCDPMDCSLPGSSIHGIFQARVLEWGAIAFSLITAAAAPKSFQSCPALCDPRDVSPPLITRGIQIKATMKYHFTTIRMATTKKTTNNKCWQGSEIKQTFVCCWWECKFVQPHVKQYGGR